MIRRLALALILATSTAQAQPLDLDTIAKQPGTEVIRNGDKVEVKRAGVTVTIDKDGETSLDHSGKAVLCYWNLAVVLKIAADLCYPEEFPQLRRMLDEQIDAANAFIAANSLRPISKAELEKSIEDRKAKAAAGIKAAGMPPAQNRVCQQQREEELIPLNAELEKYRQEFKEALAVPRPPARNPCF